MSEKIRWAILGCGKIARKFAQDLSHVKDAELVAVGARTQQAAEEFAGLFSVKYIHGSYESLVQNPEIDVVYVATPHGLHYEHVMLCLQHRKSVLCEKAFALNYRQATEMIGLAKTQGVFLMEAFWTAFLPHYLALKEQIAANKLGAIKYIHAEFGFLATPPLPQRVYDPVLGGGSLLDIGIYPVFFALDILGKPDTIEAVMNEADSGVDDQCSIIFKYNEGASAQLFSTFRTNLASGADIAGDKGRIRLTHRAHGPTTEMEYYSNDASVKEMINFEKARGNGYEYEAQHVTNCLKSGLKESPIMSFDKTLLMMETLDEIRRKAGIKYPADK